MLLDATCIVDTLVHPVPDTATHDARALLYNVPVFLKVADSLTHCVCILADEVRLVVQTAALLDDCLHSRIHVRTEVRILLAVVVALVVHEVVATRKQTLHAVVCGLEVLSATRLVTQRPEHHARMVAVAEHHALGAVHVSILPRRSVRERLVVMALHICLVHAVKTVIVEHGIHTRLTRIVACTNGIDVSLLHQHHVLQHRLGVDGVTKERMDVLRVHTLEEDTLAVYVDKIAALLNRTETILRREDHLFLVALLLTHHDGVEIRIL